MTNYESKCECRARKALEEIGRSPFMAADAYAQVWSRIDIARAALAVPCPCEQLRAGLAEALRLIERICPFLEPYSIARDDVAAVLAKHKERAS